MYRLTLYYLLVLIGVAVVESFLGVLGYNPVDILLNGIIITAVCYVSNKVFATLFKAPTNTESFFITACILVLILPTKFPNNLPFILAASVAAMGSKYFVAVSKKHLFNPAAVAVAAIAILSPEHSASWWVGTSSMMPFVLVGGLLLVRKIRREYMVGTFFLVYGVVVSALALVHGSSLVSTWLAILTHSFALFLGFVMLTEPLTSPPTVSLQLIYAGIVAILCATPQFRLPWVVAPELALCIGNFFSYVVSPKYRLMLRLTKKVQLSPDMYHFFFPKQADFAFTPGQYMEWTLPHTNTDSRGNRRYFSLNSSPTEDTIQLLVKFYSPSSTFKQKLLSLNVGDSIVASQLAGDFVLPKDLTQPLVFIAGGVGIAPFKSMIQYLLDTNTHVNCILLYANKTEEEIAYKDIFEKAKRIGIRTVYTLTEKESVRTDWKGRVGYIDTEAIKEIVPDFKERKFYISGPQLMVERFKNVLYETGVKHSQIKLDFFPGYAEK